MGSRGIGLAALIVAAISPSVVRAEPPPSKNQCLDAYEQAQRLRKAYKLRAAREQSLTCAADACPSFVRQDCAKWLTEIEASTPTIVVLARKADGSTMVGVKATLDGAAFADSLDGRAVPVDPGPHDVRAQAADGTVVQSHIVVAEGAKNQPFYLTFGGPPAAPPQTQEPQGQQGQQRQESQQSQQADATASPPEKPAEPTSGRSIPTATWVLGGIAAAGAVSFAIFAVAGKSVESCSPNCTQSQVDSLRRDYLIADVSWITGLVAAGAALYFLFTAPASDPPTPATAIRW